VCVTMAVSNLIADILSKFGNAEQKKKHLEPFLLGKLTAGAFCLSEPEAGSDPASMRTTAIKDGDSYVINGNKQWITNGDFSGLYLVFAKTNPDAPRGKGISCFVVEKGTEGLQCGRPEKKMGLRSSNTVPLTFEDCRVPAHNLIGEEGQGYAIALSVLDGGRIGISGQAIGIAEAAIHEGIIYSKERQAFGQSVAQFQASQFAIADSRAELDMAWMLMIRAAQVRDALGKSPKESSMSKVWATESCGRIVDRMLQLHGGYGYTEDYAIERLYRDARITRIYEGSSEIQRIVIARELLKD
jgi:alkylation response protein AidB-like acyl-CoA dehydrogenase